jgi:hypothetical protein
MSWMPSRTFDVGETDAASAQAQGPAPSVHTIHVSQRVVILHRTVSRKNTEPHQRVSRVFLTPRSRKPPLNVSANAQNTRFSKRNLPPAYCRRARISTFHVGCSLWRNIQTPSHLHFKRRAFQI